jgi:hypothetical protein
MLPSTRFLVRSRAELYEIARWARSGTSSSIRSNFSGFGTSQELTVFLESRRNALANKVTEVTDVSFHTFEKLPHL